MRCLMLLTNEIKLMIIKLSFLFSRSTASFRIFHLRSGLVIHFLICFSLVWLLILIRGLLLSLIRLLLRLIRLLLRLISPWLVCSLLLSSIRSLLLAKNFSGHYVKCLTWLTLGHRLWILLKQINSLSSMSYQTLIRVNYLPEMKGFSESMLPI